MQPVQMTRAEYQAKYGVPPTLPGSQIPQNTTPTPSAPVKMTRAEYQTKYGEIPENTPQTKKFDSTGMFKDIGNFLFPIVGDIKHDIEQGTFKGNGKSILQQVGDLGLSALPFIPGLGEVGEGARVGEAALEGGADVAKSSGLIDKGLGLIKGSPVAKGVLTGYGAGVASNLSQGQGLGQSFMPNANTIGGTIVGGGTAGLIKGLGLGEKTLQNSATEDITKILNPTTKENKLLTQKIAPELAQKGIISASREGLLAKYEANMGKAGDALEAGYDALPSNAKMEVTNLFDNLNKKIDDLHINGIVPSSAQDKVNALQNMMRDLSNIGVETSLDGQKVFADVDNVRSLRQILDDNIKKNFAFSNLDSAVKDSQKQLANGIRSEFASQYPDIAKLNKDFNFWSNATKVLQDTVDRKTGQTGLLRKGISAGVGAVSGLPSGHPIIGGTVMKLLSDFIESPAWHSTSALLKSKLATALINQDSNLLTGILKSISVPATASKLAQPLLNQIH